MFVYANEHSFQRAFRTAFESLPMPPKKSSQIPPGVLERLESRLKAQAAERWPNCRRVVIRQRGQFAYVDAQGTQDSQPEPLCRLRYTGDMETWEFAYFTWSGERYEPSLLSSGLPFGSPEECFDTAAFTVLQ